MAILIGAVPVIIFAGIGISFTVYLARTIAAIFNKASIGTFCAGIFFSRSNIGYIHFAAIHVAIPKIINH